MSADRWKQVLYAIGVGLIGAMLGYLPVLVKDLMFLHDARLFNEMQAIQRQQQQQQTSAPIDHIDQSQVHPGAPPAPTSSPPDKK